MDNERLTLHAIRQRLAGHAPQKLAVGDHRQAAVAMILRQRGEEVELLMIERARREGDPWSGQMGFPGGMLESSDRDPQSAAERETLEEVGLTLTGRSYLGRIDDIQGRHRGHLSGIVVSAFVYVINCEFEPTLNYEVRKVLWVPLDVFSEHERAVEVRHPIAPEERFPGIRVSADPNQVVWGLSRRFLATFFRVLDTDMIFIDQ